MFNNEYWMQIALKEAKKAYLEDEIPVGAVLVKDDQLILKNHNRTRQLNNPLAHAESLILHEIQKKEKYLYDYSLYVTLEPCLMCSGTIILSKLKKLVFGTFDPKAGVVGSIYNVLLDKHFNHHPQIETGICQDECSRILKVFFKSKREQQKQ